MNPGKVFRSVREQNALTLSEMADTLKITRSALWKIERGRVWPKQATIKELCEQFDYPVARFYVESFEKEDYGTR